MRNVAGGWQINGLVTVRSGMPLNILTGADNAMSGTPSQRPNVSGNPVLSADRTRDEKLNAWGCSRASTSPATRDYASSSAPNSSAC